jgi:hypothetical protein
MKDAFGSIPLVANAKLTVLNNQLIENNEKILMEINII